MARTLDLLTPRGARPDVRVDVWGALGATALAGAVFVVALALSVLPPLEFSIVLFSLAPAFAAVAALIFFALARQERNATFGWVAVGLSIALVALALQLISFPTVATRGGLFGTSGQGSAQLYLLFHWGVALGALLGLLRVRARWQAVALPAGIAVALLAAWDLVPSPALLTGDQAFTATTLVLEWVTAATLAALTVLWVRRWGRDAPAMYSWVAVALLLSVYELALNALSGRRFDAIWWASLSMRVATFAVLAVAGLLTVLAELRRHERYADTELDRREGELRESLAAREQLLASSEAFTRAATVAEVGETIAEAASAATGVRLVVVGLWHGESDELRVLAVRGHTDPDRLDRTRPLPRDAALPAFAALRAGQAVFTSTARQTGAAFPDLLRLPGFEGTQALATLPLRLGRQTVGVFTIADDHPRTWPLQERRTLAGLANQAASALQRARLFEREHETAETLQRGMLPRRLIQPDGLRLVARYLPGAQGMSVGGDFYDAIPVAGGCTALVLGDVMGKGAQAAAIMGRVRHTVRALASIDPEPGAVLGRLDSLADDLLPDELITLLYLLVDPVAGSVRLGRAGHLPPLVCRPDGAAEYVYAGGSRSVGLPPAARPTATLRLPPGSTLVLFSDGLVEHREDGIDPAMTSLLALLRQRCHEPDLDSLIDRLLTVRRAATGDDDTCLLLARLTGVGTARTDRQPPLGAPVAPDRRAQGALGREAGIAGT